MRICVNTPFQVGNKSLGGACPLICAPFMGESLADLEAEVVAISGLSPDIIELRVDAWDCIEDATASLERVRLVRKGMGAVPIIMTCRCPSEGGVKTVSTEAKLALYAAAIKEGLVELVDMELQYADSIQKIRGMLASTDVKLVISFHNTKKTPSYDEILAILEEQVKAGAHVAKLAAMPEREEDVLCLLQATLAFRRAHPDIPLITMSMGGVGAASRIVGGVFGSDVTFAVGSKASAPGQLPLAVLRPMFKDLYPSV